MKESISASTAIQDNPEQTTLTLDVYDVDGYSYDYTSPNAPIFNNGTFGGCTLAQAYYWTVSATTAKDGIDTPGLTLINVTATSIKYWNGNEDGELRLSAAG